jgi:hypothetical protein
VIGRAESPTSEKRVETRINGAEELRYRLCCRMEQLVVGMRESLDKTTGIRCRVVHFIISECDWPAVGCGPC